MTSTIWIIRQNSFLYKMEQEMQRQILMAVEDKKLIEYYQLVTDLIANDPDLLKELVQAVPPNNNKQGPKMPPFAIARHKEVVFLSGINKVLLKKLVLISKENKSSKSKSDIVNEIFQFWVENNGNLRPNEPEDED